MKDKAVMVWTVIAAFAAWLFLVAVNLVFWIALIAGAVWIVKQIWFA